MRLRITSNTLLIFCTLTCSGCRLWQTVPLTERSVSPEVLSALEWQLRSPDWKPNPKWTPLQTSRLGFGKPAKSERRHWIFGKEIVEVAIDQLDFALAEPQTPNKSPSTEPADSSQTETGSTERKPEEVPSTAQDIQPAENLVDPLEETEREESPHDRQAGFWPLNVSVLLNAVDEETHGEHTENLQRAASADEYLKILSRRDNLVGWNATILWALRSPGNAKETLSSLQRIVTESLKYDPETLQEIKPVAKATAHEASFEKSNSPANSRDPISDLLKNSSAEKEKQGSLSVPQSVTSSNPLTAIQLFQPGNCRFSLEWSVV